MQYINIYAYINAISIYSTHNLLCINVNLLLILDKYKCNI